MIWQLKNLIQTASENQVEINHEWVPGRPLSGFFLERVKGAWLVLSGKADAVIWPSNQ